jgi:radical SAM protein with 4Fe4S-binding SPASM domain
MLNQSLGKFGMKNNFCILPWIHLSTRVDGNVAPCCRSMQTVGNIADETLEQIWNNKHMQKLRKELLNDERPEGCWPCYQLEDQGSVSMRQTMNKTRNWMYPFDEDEEHTQVPFNIPVLELKLSNLCNFRCRTCKPDLSTTWLKDWAKVKDEYEDIGWKNDTTRQENYNNPEFLANIEKLAPTMEIVEFAGGEPLMDPMHYKVLEALRPHGEHITVKYSTNLSKLKYGKFDALEAWKDFRSVDISLSIDGHPELNEYIRTEANTKQIAENLKKVKLELGDKFEARAALCYSAWNVMGLPEAYDYFTFELDLPVHGNIAWAPKFINPQILPVGLKDTAEKKYKAYLEKVKTYDISTSRKKRIERFINTNLNFLLAEQKSENWDQFLRFSKKLDASRDTNLFDIVPEFKRYE